MKSEYFKSVVSYINSRGFINETVSCSHRQVNQCNRNLESALKAQLVSSSENIDLPTPPSTCNQREEAHQTVNSRQIVKARARQTIVPATRPNLRKKKRSIEQLKVDQDLSPPSKRKKIREAATAVMKSINQVCEENRETLGYVLGECCLLTGEDGRAARESVQSVFHSMVEEKGVQKAFAKLLPEEAWNKRVQCMRVPDWIYPLFKLKSRISDSGWQDLTNLTKLGRTGVSKLKFLFHIVLLNSVNA